jgi:hypothetical protein
MTDTKERRRQDGRTSKGARPDGLTEQQGIVIDYLKRGSTLTNKVALTCLGVGSLSSRVAELRRMGFNIVDRMDVDRDGRRFRKYDLAKGGE